MKKMLILVLLFALNSCKKKHDNIYGLVSVSGKITDIVSNAPIPNAIVQLNKVVNRPDGLGGTTPVTTDVAVTDTTDALGNYAFSYTASGEYEFEIVAIPTDPLHVYSGYSSGIDRSISSPGSFTRDIPCNRSAFAKITITNVPPIDTPYFISASAGKSITLNNFYKDTIVYLQLVGRTQFPNYIRFNKNNQQNYEYYETVGPWDTVGMQFNY